MGRSNGSRALPLEQAFTPAEPIRSPPRLQGRDGPLERARRVLSEPGRHLLLLGERGVGRTSFAFSAAVGYPVRYHAAGLGDSFQHIVARLLPKAPPAAADHVRGAGRVPPGSARGSPSPDETEVPLEPETGVAGDPAAADPWSLVRPEASGAVLVIDDLDLACPEAIAGGVLPLLRALSDAETRTKVILVTRRDRPFPQALSGAGLRLFALVLDRLDDEALSAVLEQGARAGGLRFAPDLRQRIVQDAEGLPGLVHALALEAGRAAQEAGRKTATLARDYLPALQGLVSSLEPSLAAHYEAATAGRSRRNRFAHVLWAAALCPQGRFGLTELEQGLARIEGRPVPPQAFAVHLGDLLKRDLLVRLREGRYRFADPAMRAYVRLLLRRDHPALMGDDPLQLGLPY
jgi:hypothetical protein